MSPQIQEYEIYADETYIRGPIAFAFGAIICTPRRTEILEEEISKLRERFNFRGEVKWDKTTAHKLPFFKAFADVFFDDRFVRFSLMKIKKGLNWRSWAESEEERFFKSYYIFLAKNTGPFSEYKVFADEKSLQKGYRWTTVHFLINRKRRESWGLRRKNIRSLQAVSSERYELLQLADLLLGSLTSSAEARGKKELRKHVSTRCECAQEKKLRIETWSPGGRSAKRPQASPG